MNKKIIAGLIVIAAVATGLVVFYSKSSSPGMAMGLENTSVETPTAGVSESSIKEFTITGGNFFFAPSTLTVKKGDRVKIIFKNQDGFHDLRIDELDVATKRIGTGQEDKVIFTADRAGTFEYYCSVGGHRQMGMKGQLIVTE